MSINTINNQIINSGVIDNLALTVTDSDSMFANTVLNKKSDWFRLEDGKALPISVQTRFGDTSSMDEMLSAMLGHLRLV